MIDEWRSFPNKAEKLKSKFEIINLFGKIKSAIIEEQDHWVVVFFWGTPFKIYCHPRKSWKVYRLSKANKSLVYKKETKYINGIPISLEEALNSEDMPTEVKRALVFNLNEFEK